MPERVREATPPQGLRRWLYRLPIWLYRLGLGRLLGHRFLLLTTVGRKTGLPRQAVVEVLRHDPATDTYYVLSAWGERADWYRNLRHDPRASIQVSGRRFAARHSRLSPQATEREILDFARRHPFLARQLPRLLGYRLDGTQEDYRALARDLVAVALRPEKSPGH